MKKIKKISKKVLTNEGRGGILIKLSPMRDRQGDWLRETQDVVFKRFSDHNRIKDCSLYIEKWTKPLKDISGWFCRFQYTNRVQGHNLYIEK